MNEAPIKTKTEVFRGKNGKLWLKQTNFWTNKDGELQEPTRVLVELTEDALLEVRPYVEESNDSSHCQRCQGSPVLAWDGYHSLDDSVKAEIIGWLC